MRGTQGDFNSVTSVYVLSWIMDSWMLVSLFPIHFVCRKYGLILFKREKFKLETNREGVYISGTLLFGQESKLLVPPHTPPPLFSLSIFSLLDTFGLRGHLEGQALSSFVNCYSDLDCLVVFMPPASSLASSPGPHTICCSLPSAHLESRLSLSTPSLGARVSLPSPSAQKEK